MTEKTPITFNTELVKGYVQSQLSQLRAFREAEDVLSQLQGMETYLKQVQADVDNAQKAASEAKAKVAEEMAAAYAEVSIALHNRDTQVEALTAEVDEMKNDAADLKAQLAKDSANAIAEAEAELAQIEAEKNVAKDARDALVAEINTLTKQRDALNSTLSAVKSTLA